VFGLGDEQPVEGVSMVLGQVMRRERVDVLDVARARGIRWERAETTMLAYEPRSQQPPMWILKRQATPLLELSDADCIAAAK